MDDQSLELSEHAAYLDWARSQLNSDKVSIHTAWRGENSTVYSLTSDISVWYLKIGANLRPEYERLNWIDARFPAPSVVSFLPGIEHDALLTTAVEGKSLAVLCKIWNGNDVASCLATALRRLHAIDSAGCPFGEITAANVLVHGDACLPNVLFTEDRQFAGFVDLGELRLGNADVDLSAAVWSLQYNMGPGYGLTFLQAYGLSDADDTMVEHLRQMYESRSS